MKKFLCLFLLILIAAGCCSCTPKDAAQPGVSGSMTVYFIDVGQGDCTLIESAGRFMLIDSGETEYADTVLDFLHSRGVEKLTYVIATHPHSDHVGGLRKIINAIDTENFITCETDSDTYVWTKLLKAVNDRQINYIDAKVGAAYSLGEADFTILAPVGSGYEGYNNYSVVVRIRCGDVSLLMPGDAEKESEYEMLDLGEDVSADILKCGHHGSSDATSSRYLQAVDPAYAIISCSADNEYGHPHRETLERLELLGTRCLRTDELGTITCAVDGSTVRFAAQNLSETYTVGQDSRDPSVLSFVGNRNSHIFHDPICQGAKDMNPKNKTTFSSRQEALDAGYTPCPNCRP